MGSIGRVSANLTSYCALKQALLCSWLVELGVQEKRESWRMKTGMGCCAVANGGDGMGEKKKDNKRKRRREEGEDGSRN
jgi:hypothetical protein